MSARPPPGNIERQRNKAETWPALLAIYVKSGVVDSRIPNNDVVENNVAYVDSIPIGKYRAPGISTDPTWKKQKEEKGKEKQKGRELEWERERGNNERENKKKKGEPRRTRKKQGVLPTGRRAVVPRWNGRIKGKGSNSLPFTFFRNRSSTLAVPFFRSDQLGTFLRLLVHFCWVAFNAEATGQLKGLSETQ